MSRGLIALMMVLVAVTGCGTRRPLIRPAQIPAFEEKERKKMEKFDAEDAEENAKEAAAKDAEAKRAADENAVAKPDANVTPPPAPATAQ